MLLYELKPSDRFTLQGTEEPIFTLQTISGSYAHCTDAQLNLHHIDVTAPVVIIDESSFPCKIR